MRSGRLERVDCVIKILFSLSLDVLLLNNVLIKKEIAVSRNVYFLLYSGIRVQSLLITKNPSK